MPLEIKICGLRDEASLDAALDGGADMVGFVFFPPSPRDIAVAEAAPLIARARGRALSVALTVDPDDALLDAVVERARPGMIQLHGRETPQRVAEIRARTGLPVMKAVGIAAAEDLATIAPYRGVADRILVDAKPPKGADRPGGHGRAFDWSLLAALDASLPFMLSGGLTADNVADAVRAVRPAGVDVSSGVERAPGIKDTGLIARFIAEARAADRPADTERVD
ncbi:MAG: phosphoribosylanthranilate isomerase [Flavobacteriaceae bacterium]